ncbi:RsmB/NOP family class I SAM-dependent RNA methyltransferase [Oricola sp.]|uniref:RsmB/NOP family class I SAM-dependent RNA methyltransferase n=1 Tax=Oricola sp. TaxID=1979950 RepID=UPI0025E708E3|nr:RsmB/NOP family class I SAM-dependent RNA methyltransferase [Oricola sp.]MCI5075128.1 MFS transporter [Oricola sp.]
MGLSAPARRRRPGPRKTDQAAPRPDDKPGLATRQAAHRILGAILDAKSSMDGLTDEVHGHPHYLALELRDRALVRAMLLASLRHYGDLDDTIRRFTEKPLPAGATGLRNILIAGLAQILFLDVPDHSAVDLAVTAAQADPRSRRFARLVNALLRRASRDKDGLLARFAEAPVRAPQWFADRLDAIHGPETAARIDACHRVEAPIDLTLKAGEQPQAAEWAEKLEAIVLPTGSLRLTGASREIPSLPGYDTGAWWVQDAAAAMPARLFGDLEGKRAADLCAAPGGKTAQMLDAGATVTALDLSANRLKRLHANLERLGLGSRCETVAVDMFAFAPEGPFDAVLLDAPCSSTGTVRRHPDVPFTKSPADIEKLAGLQARMLDHAATLVAPGGLLVFSNCSLDPLEGETVARDFAGNHPEFEIVPVTGDEAPGVENAVTPEGFLRLTPAHLDLGDPATSGVDGFFAARFRRLIG